MAQRLTAVQVTIANGASLSGSTGLIPTGDLVAVVTDAAWDAAGITFQGSYDGVTFFNLYSATAEVAVASVTAGAMIGLDPLPFKGAQFLKVRSGTGAAAVNQSGATVATLLFRTVK